MKPVIALISNPRSTRNGRLLPEIRKFVSDTPSVFHVELHDISEVSDALRLIARVAPKVLVINGGDGTVQAVLTALYHEKAFGDVPPPVTVLPNGKTNLIATDLGISGAPLRVLQRIVELARTDNLARHTVMRPLIALEDGRRRLPVMGMFLGGAGLKDTILFCRHKIYPLGLPNKVSHALTSVAFFWSVMIGSASRLAYTSADKMRITTRKSGSMEGNFTVLMVTTLDHLLMDMQPLASGFTGGLKMLCVEGRRRTLFRALGSLVFSKLGRIPINGLHMRHTDEIRLDGPNTSVILDGELFVAAPGRSMILRTTEPQRFVSLTAA
jgi:Diacylglycerol kinase catalytic domain